MFESVGLQSKQTESGQTADAKRGGRRGRRETHALVGCFDDERPQRSADACVARRPRVYSQESAVFRSCAEAILARPCEALAGYVALPAIRPAGSVDPGSGCVRRSRSQPRARPASRSSRSVRVLYLKCRSARRKAYGAAFAESLDDELGLRAAKKNATVAQVCCGVKR